MSYSPAPWKFVSDSQTDPVPFDYDPDLYYDNPAIVDANGIDVVGCGEYNVFRSDNQAANVALLLAAPDLLAALQSLLAETRHLDDAGPLGQECQSDALESAIKASDMAIAKALGDQNG